MVCCVYGRLEGCGALFRVLRQMVQDFQKEYGMKEINLEQYKGTFPWVDEIIKELEALRISDRRQKDLIETVFCMVGAQYHMPICSRCAEALYSPSKKDAK